MDFGAFILGILFGWLVEWLYVTFFSSKGTGMGDCTAFERELKTRNDEIKSLKSQLSDNSQGGASLLSKASKQSTAKASTVSNKPKLNKSKAEAATKNTKSSKASPASKTSNKKATAPAKKGSSLKKSASTKEVAKSTKSKVLPKKVAGTASTSTTKNATKTAVKKSASSKPTTKTVKKTTARSTTTKKKPAAKKISLKKDIKLNNPTGDDLTKLSGIGPSMAATLGELGITSYKKLAAMDDDILRDMLEASGARLNNNKEAMDSWNEQATLADKGDFTGLKKLQESLKS